MPARRHAVPAVFSWPLKPGLDPIFASASIGTACGSLLFLLAHRRGLSFVPVILFSALLLAASVLKMLKARWSNIVFLFALFAALVYLRALVGTRLVGPQDPESLRVFGLDGLRELIRCRFDSELSYESAKYMEATLLGDPLYRELDFYNFFKDCGLLHAVAISGQHLTIIAVIAERALRSVKINKRKRILSSVFLIGAYCVLTDLGPSIVRSLLMNVFVMTSALLGRKSSLLDATAVSAVAILFFVPEMIADVGFQLSILGIAGIGLFADGISAALFGRKGLLAEIISSSIASQTCVLPLLVAKFGQISGVFLVANVVILPLIPLTLAMGLLSAFLPLKPLFFLLEALVGLLKWLARIFYSNPISLIVLRVSPLVFTLIHCGCCAAVIALVSIARIKKGVINCMRALIVIYFVVVMLFPFLEFYPASDRAVFFDVGQGDSSLVTSKAGAKVMVDCGPDSATPCSWMALRGIRRIDLLVLSHLHHDHVGGLRRIVDKFRVMAIAVPYFEAQKVRSLLKSWGKEGQTSLIELEEGDELALKNDLSVAALVVGGGHDDDSRDRAGDEEFGKLVSGDAGTEGNERCMINMVRLNGVGILYTADAPSELLGELSAAGRGELGQIAVLKVPHHGSKGSFNEAFLELVSPEFAVISVGKDNNFGFPKRIWIDYFRERSVRVLRTDLDGNICLQIDDNGAVELQ